jgi:O-antigen ligase
MRPGVNFDYQQRLIAVLIALTFVGYPVYSFLSVALRLSEFDSRTITIPYRIGMLSLSLFLFFGGALRRELLVSSRAHAVFYLVWLLYLARLVSDTLLSETVLSRPAWEYWAFAFGVSFLSFLGMMRRLDERTSRLAAWIIWWLALSACTLGLVTQAGQISISQERISGNQILNPISFGQTAVTLVLLSGYLALHVRKVKTVVFLVIATIPAFLTIAASASRSPLVSLAVGMILLTVHGIQRGIGWKVALGVLIGAILFPVGLQYLFVTGSTLTTRLFETYDAYRIGEVDRFVLWGQAIEEYLRSPLLGAGLELGIGVHPHNLVLESFLAMGVLGGVLFTTLVVMSVRNSVRLLSSAEAGWMPLIFMQFFALSLFSGQLWGSMEFWAIILLQAGAIVQFRTQHVPRRPLPWLTGGPARPAFPSTRFR